MALLLVALGLFIQLRFRNQLDKTIDEGLRTHADDLAALVTQSGGVLSRSETRLLSEQESLAEVVALDGRVVDAAAQLRRAPLLSPTELRRAATDAIFLTKDDARAFEGPARLLAQPFQARGRRLIVVVGSSLDDRDAALDNLRTILLIGGPLALLLASIAGYGMAVAALRPVEAMRRRAAAISAERPAERLPVPAAEDELARLGETLNQMLARLEAAIERERTFVDDASHELRTPLALLRTELELAHRYETSSDELRAAVGSAIEEVDRLIQLAADLLVLARSEKGHLELELGPVELGELLETVRERFAERAAKAERPFAVDAPSGIRIRGDRLRLEQALTNMVDNALRHGRGAIRVAAGEADGGATLHVTDEGPGFAPDFIDRAFERFTRADSARASGGTGLGLAIVEAIARAHGGRARAANRAEGGADVWIELPARAG